MICSYGCASIAANGNRPGGEQGLPGSDGVRGDRDQGGCLNVNRGGHCSRPRAGSPALPLRGRRSLSRSPAADPPERGAWKGRRPAGVRLPPGKVSDTAMPPRPPAPSAWANGTHLRPRRPGRRPPDTESPRTGLPFRNPSRGTKKHGGSGGRWAGRSLPKNPGGRRRCCLSLRRAESGDSLTGI